MSLSARAARILWGDLSLQSRAGQVKLLLSRNCHHLSDLASALTDLRLGVMEEQGQQVLLQKSVSNCNFTVEKRCSNLIIHPSPRRTTSSYHQSPPLLASVPPTPFPQS